MRFFDGLAGIFAPEREVFRLVKGGTTYTITEKLGKRAFRVNGKLYSMLSGDSIYVGSYWDYFSPLPSMFKKPRVLVIGLGIGTIPHQLTSMYGNAVSVTAVDNNPELPGLARRFLPRSGRKFGMVVADGARFVRKHRDYYDIIVQDAFVDLDVPREFLRQGFMEDAKAALTANGILAINYISNFGHPMQYTNALRKHFRHVYTINRGLSGNYIIICSKGLGKHQMLSAIRSGMKTNAQNRRLIDAYSAMY